MRRRRRRCRPAMQGCCCCCRCKAYAQHRINRETRRDYVAVMISLKAVVVATRRCLPRTTSTAELAFVVRPPHFLLMAMSTMMKPEVAVVVVVDTWTSW